MWYDLSMKKIITIVSVITFVLAIDIYYSNKSDARTTCSRDVWGNVNCRSSGGGSWSIQKDVWGNDTIRNNRTGQSTTCRTDVWGNYVCD